MYTFFVNIESVFIFFSLVSNKSNLLHCKSEYSILSINILTNAKDISENKVFAMLVYLLGVMGVIIALLASSSSAYTKFHLRQALKFTVVEILTGIVSLLLVWTVIVPVLGGIFICVLEVIKIICFFQVCSGKAKEPAIIRSLNFLK